MGEILNARCPSCSFSKQVKFGFGMIDMGRTLHAPVLDKKSGQMKVINLKDQSVDTNRYHLYTEPYRDRDRTLTRAYQAGDICIRPGGHRCPECGGNDMRFESVALFD